jgi:hypothetical protein
MDVEVAVAAGVEVGADARFLTDLIAFEMELAAVNDVLGPRELERGVEQVEVARREEGVQADERQKKGGRDFEVRPRHNVFR